jgi:hypothetical protein
MPSLPRIPPLLEDRSNFPLAKNIVTWGAGVVRVHFELASFKRKN